MWRITRRGARWEYGVDAAQWLQDHAAIVAALCVVAWLAVVVAIGTAFLSLSP